MTSLSVCSRMFHLLLQPAMKVKLKLTFRFPRVFFFNGDSPFARVEIVISCNCISIAFDTTLKGFVVNLSQIVYSEAERYETLRKRAS